ncbi:response regulator transcription factor [Nocardioides sp. URHA0020]|uniref:response regulator transcription factor n=1 Tax=Nocardioides sp. URHA0020 TaxID=1380392 RepID=UPI0004919148|nr:response regulator transcription factor [Nocardioides sp. URHA0020]
MEGVTQRARRAVVVEDDRDIRELITHTLSDLGLEVTAVDSGPAGVAAVRAINPDLVTLDLGLPGIDGIEVCRQIREESDAYIIMVTARSDEIDRLLGLETGADDFMSKPFSLRELQARVNAMFRRPRPGITAEGDAAELLTYGVLRVDVSSRRVYRDGEELLLTRTEFDLLTELMRSPARVVTREELLKAVWGTPWIGDTHVVEVHVGNLRRKLGGSRFIRTVRGVGYRMEEHVPQA